MKEYRLNTANGIDCLLLNGDSHEYLSHQKFGGNVIVVTDPPFNVGYHYDQCKDKMDESEYVQRMCSIFSTYPSVVIHYPEDLYKFAMKMNKVPNRVVSWIYNSNTAKQHRDIAYFGVEPDFSGIGEYKNPTDKRVMKLMAEGKKPRGYDWIYQDQVKNVSKEKTSHPCQMPLEVMEYVMKTLPKDSIILEPFAGSGTTLVAANKLGFKCIGIEMSDEYCQIIINRMEKVDERKVD